MKQSEIKERMDSIAYILYNNLVSEDAKVEAEADYEKLRAMLPKDEVNEDVTQPSHYKLSIETYREILKNKDAYEGFLLGNAIKYLHRCEHKHPSPVDDLRKSKYYINKMLDSVDA